MDTSLEVRVVTSQPVIGVVSALAEEIAPLKRRVQRARTVRIQDIEVLEGELCGKAVRVAALGEGRQLAAAGIECLFGAGELSGLIGLGVAGGLTEDLEVGTVLDAKSIRDGDFGTLAVPSWPEIREVGAGIASGTVVTVDRIVKDPEAKRALASHHGLTSAGVVDLESSVWAKAASERNLPWRVLRSVSDAVDETLPLDFDAFRAPDGSISRARIAAYVAVRPRLIRPLDRLRRRLQASADALADAAEGLLGC